MLRQFKPVTFTQVTGGKKTVKVEFVAKTKNLNPLLLEVTEVFFLYFGGKLLLL